MPLTIRYSAEAAAQLAEQKAKALANPAGAPAAAYNAYAKIITDVIANPDLVLLTQNMLKDDLAGICRVKVGRRIRIFYLVSSKHQAATVLLLGYRKEGDKHDAYEVLRRLLRRGAFDACFAELGITKPKSR